MRIRAYSLLLLAPAAALAQAPEVPGCEPEPGIRAAIYSAKQFVAGENRPYPEVQKEQAAKLKALLDKYPDNFFVHKAYIEGFPASMGGSSDVVAAYRKRAADNSQSPGAQYLYARALMGVDTPESLRLLNKLAGEYPKFPAVLGTLGAIYGFPAFKDDARLAQLTEAYYRACPGSPHAFERLSRAPLLELQREAAPKFRKLLTARTDEEAMADWPVLWRMEFSATPVAGHGALREQIRRDLEGLKKWDAQKYPQLKRVLAEGYRTIGDKEAERAAREALPLSGLSRAFEAMREWGKMHRLGRPGAPDGDREAYYEARYKAGEEWARMAPEEPFLILDRARSLAKLKNHPDSEFVGLMDRYFEMEKAKASSVFGGMDPKIEIAGLYAERGVRLEQVPGLVEAGLEAQAKKSKAGVGRSDLFGAPEGEREAYSRHSTLKAGREAMLEAYLKQGRMEKARETVTAMEGELAAWRKQVSGWSAKVEALPKDKPGDVTAMIMQSAVRGLSSEEAAVEESLARLAAAENRKADALAFYQAGVRRLPAQQRDRPVAEARKLWRDVGGTEEGWQRWLAEAQAGAAGGRVASPTEWTRTERAMPEFALADISGRTWKKADLAGKTVFINFWATWCGPCREELGPIEKLYQRVKQREDVVVVTVNVDEDIGAVAPFVTENQYTFPVLLAGRDAAEKFLGDIAIPRNWLVDGTGVVRYEMMGFDEGTRGSGEWVEGILRQIELVRGAGK
jgi:thiol-disulfide isomerase/thioredoxin